MLQRGLRRVRRPRKPPSQDLVAPIDHRRLRCNYLRVFVLLVGAQLLVLVAMVAVSSWGAKNLRDEARVPARLGTSGFDWTMNKKTTLRYAPALGSVVFIGTIAISDSDNPETVAAIGLGILVMLFLAHWSSVKRAAR